MSDGDNVRLVAREVRLEDEARIAKLETQLAAMTKDRDLWQNAHDDDCPNKAMLVLLVCAKILSRPAPAKEGE